MERYANKIERLKEDIDRKTDHVMKVEDEIGELQKDLRKYEELQKQLPERHMHPWDEQEKCNLRNALDRFIEGMAKNHKRTPVAIKSRINVEKWLHHYQGDAE